MTEKERKEAEELGLVYKNEDIPVIPKHQAETMMLHLEIANRNIAIVAIVSVLAMVAAIIIFVSGYTSRTKDWLNTYAQLQAERPAATEVADGIQQQPSP